MSNENEIKAVIDSFYEIISGKADEERDWNRLKSLFYGNGNISSMRFSNSGDCLTKCLDVDTYTIGLSKFLAANDFYEYGLNYDIKVFGSIAQVYSEYEAKRDKDDSEVIKKGVNLIQLINDGCSWKIHSMLWQDYSI